MVVHIAKQDQSPKVMKNCQPRACEKHLVGAPHLQVGLSDPDNLRAHCSHSILPLKHFGFQLIGKNFLTMELKLHCTHNIILNNFTILLKFLIISCELEHFLQTKFIGLRGLWDGHPMSAQHLRGVLLIVGPAIYLSAAPNPDKCSP